MKPLPETDRLSLRRLSPDDLAAFQAYRSDPDVGRFQGWTPMDEDQAQGFLKDVHQSPLFRPGRWSQIAIACPRSDALWGDLGICLSEDETEAEVGITLARPQQGRGLGRLAYGLISDHLFQTTPIQRVVGIAHEDNTASLAMLRAAGLTFVETLTSEEDGQPLTEHVYHLPRPE